MNQLIEMAYRKRMVVVLSFVNSAYTFKLATYDVFLNSWHISLILLPYFPLLDSHVVSL